MNPLDVVNEDDEQFTLLLARYSEALLSGGNADPAADPALSPDMRQRLHRDLDCVRRLLHFQPPHPRPEAVTIVLEKDITLQDDLVGQQMGRFHLLRPLGYGGGGTVFLAFDPDLRREVALKIPHLPALMAPDVRRRFFREARAAAQLDHPNLVPVYEVAQTNGVCFLVSAYCRGGSLAQWLAARTTPAPFRQTAQWLAELADAVQYVHSRGIYHRDIKPGNILLDPQRSGSVREGNASVAYASGSLEQFTPRLSDFGLAKLHDAQTEATRSGTVLGTVSYMAPEQVEGRLRDISQATDVYGLGAVLYEMLAGRPPFRGATDTDTLRQVLADEPEPPRRLRRDVPSDLQTICLKCLEKEPERRYASAAKLAEDLRRFLVHEPILARPLGRSKRLHKWVRRRPTKAILMASSLLIALVLGIARFQFTSLEQARDADRASAAKQDEERQQAIRQREQHLHQLHYAEDIAQAWRCWENRKPEYMASSLDKYPAFADPDKGGDLRGFEWYLLSRLARSRPLVMRYPVPLHPVALSPDATICASGHHDGAIVLWDIATGRKLGILEGHKLNLTSLAYSPDGHYLASGSGWWENNNLSGELSLWDARTRKVLSVFAGSLGNITSLAFSPDGQTLATVVHLGKDNSEVRFWEIPSLKLKRLSPFPASRAGSAAFSSDGKVLAIGLENGKTALCDGVTGRVLETRSGHQDWVKAVACGHKDAVFVSGGKDGRVRLCSLRPGGSVLAEYRHEAEVWSVALSADDRIGASICEKGILKVWDCANGSELFSRDLPWAGRSVVFSADGKTLAVGLEDGRLWIYDVFRSPEGKVWINEDARFAETLSWPGHCHGKRPCEAWAVAFSPDSKILASAGDDHCIRFWDPASGRERAVLRGHHSLVSSIAFSPDGKLLASGSFDLHPNIKLWDVATGTAVATLRGHAKAVYALAFAPNGKYLATAGRDGVTRLWDVATGAEQPILSGYSIESLAFSPDGQTLALADNYRTLLLWDMQLQKVRRTLPHSSGHGSLAFSPDGKTLATGGHEGAVRFLDAATGELRCSARSHSDVVNCLAFAPDGKTLASASFDKKVKLWQTATGRELLTLPEQKDRVRWLAFSPDGTMLATAGHDGVLKIYRTGSEHEAQPSR